MIFKSDKMFEFTEEEKKAFEGLTPPEERTDWGSQEEQIIHLLRRVNRLKSQNAYLKGKVEVLEGFATRRLEVKENGEWELLR